MSDINKQIDDTSVASRTTKSGKEVVFDPEVLKALIQQESNRAELRITAMFLENAGGEIRITPRALKATPLEGFEIEVREDFDGGKIYRLKQLESGQDE